MTTGPGVIMATATASRNCCSFSHWYSFTTPPYKKGTMASPLPKTNAPAFKKNHQICASLLFMYILTDACSSTGKKSFVLICFLNEGGDLYSQTMIPPASISQRISFSATNVVIANNKAMIQSTRSLPRLFLDSL